MRRMHGVKREHYFIKAFLLQGHLSFNSFIYLNKMGKPLIASFFIKYLSTLQKTK